MTPGPRIDNRKARTDATRHALMRAAEKLVAEHGIENISIRLILEEAGQKNTSALQYHFKSLNGLIEAIQAERSLQIQQRRDDQLQALVASTSAPAMRELCQLMVQPVFDLARAQVDFRRYIKAFGHKLVLSETSALAKAESHGAGGGSGYQLGTLLRRAMPHLDEPAWRRRMESAVRLCSASMYHEARQSNAFRGPRAELFFNSLIDGLVGLLSAPESEQTRAAAIAVRDSR